MLACRAVVGAPSGLGDAADALAAVGAELARAVIYTEALRVAFGAAAEVEEIVAIGCTGPFQGHRAAAVYGAFQNSADGVYELLNLPGAKLSRGVRGEIPARYNASLA